MKCQKCGCEIEQGAAFCGFCGASFEAANDVSTAPSTENQFIDWQNYDVFDEARKSSSKKRTVLLAVGWVWLGLVLAAWGTLAALFIFGVVPMP